MSKPDPKALEEIAQTFRALSEPLRVAILHELKAGPKTVGALLEVIPTSQANLSKHLKVLFEGRFLSREKRGTSVIYAIDTDMALPLCELVCSHINRHAQAPLIPLALSSTPFQSARLFSGKVATPALIPPYPFSPGFSPSDMLTTSEERA